MKGPTKLTVVVITLALGFGSGFAGNCLTDLESAGPSNIYDCWSNGEGPEDDDPPAATCAELCADWGGHCTNENVCEYGTRAFDFKASCSFDFASAEDIANNSTPVDIACDEPLAYEDVQYYGCCCK
jgi:hypothetical protein